MRDAFAIFTVSRRPWLDPAALDDRYHELAGETHPDTGGEQSGNEEFADLNLAWRTLCEPPARLRHLLQLEFPAQATGQDLAEELPEDLVELFMDIGSFSKGLKTYTDKIRAAQTEMAQALLAPEGSGIVREAKVLLDRIYEHACVLDRETKSLDRAWIAEDFRDGPAIASLQHRWALVAKWRNKLRDDLLTLEEELGD